ncbi:hypothetical protein EH223_04480 [candidate division KSB1 bacterium]|nr:hypothetical protein [candidate division KSB1 bacterium]RQW05537.1 MAG: hypothetical protein EH223_04480 [candidate division KSB1 bacterium]
MKYLSHFLILLSSISFLVIQCENEAEPTNEPGDPLLGIHPVSLQLTGSSMSDVITIYNRGGGQVQWNIASSPPWLTALPASGVVTADSARVFLTTEFEMLEYGEHDGIIKVQSNAGSADIAVTLHYSAPQLRIGTTILNLDRHYSFGDFIIENTGGGGLEWHITETPMWLDFEVLSDIVYGRAQAAVPFRVDFRKIEYGEYTDTVRVESNGGAADITTYLIYYREEEVYPGIGAANIELGNSYNRVKQILGNPDRNWYERPEKTVFIHFFIYEDLGLLFSVQNNSPVLYGTGPVGYIKVFAPYDGLTIEKRIGINSSLADVLAAYGTPTSIDGNLYNYDIGITFEIKDDLVTAMIIE